MRYHSILSVQIPKRPYTSRSISYNLSSVTPWIRPLPNTTSADSDTLASDFIFYPSFFNILECRELLKGALWKLDRGDSTRRRRARGRGIQPTNESDQDGMEGLQSLFDGGLGYGFEEGHYDSVIHHYRETLLSSLPPTSQELPSLFRRIYDLLPLTPSSPLTEITRNGDSLPPPQTSTHLLHLSPKGKILSHVDNLEASGSVIIGLSLGSERVLRLEKKRSEFDGSSEEGGGVGWDIRLPSGSVYVQRDVIRYNYLHSILPYDHPGSVWEGERLKTGHRVSVMIRDAPNRQAQL